MRKIFKKVLIINIILTLIFLLTILLLNFYNLKYRATFVTTISSVIIITFFLCSITIPKEETKIEKIINLVISIIVTIFLLFLLFTFLNRKEHVVTLNNKKYVVIVEIPFINGTELSFYDYYGNIIMGNKEVVHGTFNSFRGDPYITDEVDDEVKYIYRENNKKEIIMFKKTNIEEINNNEKKTNEKDNNQNDDIKENWMEIFLKSKIENYIDDLKRIMYSKELGGIIYRFVQIDYSLGQNIMIKMYKSYDGGKTFECVTKEFINVSSDAMFTILNDKLIFVSRNKSIELKDGRGLYISNDGGVTFNQSIIHYKNNMVDKIKIEKMPYYENNFFRMVCLSYEYNDNLKKYENKKVLLYSKDNGLNWNEESFYE